MMKSKLMLVLVGAAFLMPQESTAQRVRDRDGERSRVRTSTRPAPITVSGRLSGCRAPAGARAFDCSRRVVYSSFRRSPASRGNRAWIRTDWSRARLSFRGATRARSLNQSQLRDILGRRTVERVRAAGRSVGLRGSLRGQWEHKRRGSATLVILMNRVKVAEFLDYNGDGRIDDVFVIGNAERRWDTMNRRATTRW
jgi:hypothetical protein